MDIILKQDVKNLGYKYDVVKVKPGYARNFLIPQGMAELATPGNLRMNQELIKQTASKLEKLKGDAEVLAKKLEGAKLKVGAKVGESGRIFGAVTTIQVADALDKAGFNVDRKKIELKDSIKELGEYVAHIDLHKEVKAEVKFEVVAD